MARSSCSVCGWTSRDWPSRDQAGCDATWHVYENHPREWGQLFGAQLPRDPDPRKA